MRVSSFTVGVKHHINLGDYESMEVESSVTMELGNADNLIVARRTAQEMLEALQEESFEKQRQPKWFDKILTKVVKQKINLKQVTE